jgi:hypothetical protein
MILGRFVFYSSFFRSQFSRAANALESALGFSLRRKFSAIWTFTTGYWPIGAQSGASGICTVKMFRGGDDSAGRFALF